jgi:hypothetical protein
MSTSEKWYDRVRTQTIARIEETLNTLKTLHTAEGDATTTEELEEILTQQLETISDLQTHTQALATSTTTRRNISTNTDTGAEDQQVTYTYQYTAEPDEK